MGPKKGLALLLSPDKGDEEEAPSSSKGESEDFDDAANDAFDAIKSGDKEAFGVALRRAVMCCTEGEE